MVKGQSKLNLGVIFGGRSGEHEVSLMSAHSVLYALDRDKYEVIQIGIAQDGTWWSGDHVLETFENEGRFDELFPVSLLPDPTRSQLVVLSRSDAGDTPVAKPSLGLDAIFPVLHGTFGEDGTLQGMLEMADIAYVGAGVLGSALGMDKALFKDVMRANDIPVVEAIVYLRSEIEKDMQSVLCQAEEFAPYPLFVKPANLGSSVGITKCASRSDLIEGLIEACRYDRKVIVERGLDAREIEVSVLGNDAPVASIPGEILPSREFYSYEAKYIDGKSGLIIPAPLPEDMTRHIQDLAVRAYRAIDCSGMARVDFLLEKAPRSGDGLYLGELNTIPGFTKISMYPKLWEFSGLSYAALLDRLVELAIERKVDRDRIERHYSKE